MSESSTATMSVRQWMSSSIHTLSRDATVRDVLELMKREKISSVPVVGDGGVVVGIVTIGDLARVVLSTDQLLDSDYPHYEDCFWAVDLIQRRLGGDTVTHVMTESVVSIDPEQTMAEAAMAMNSKSIRHLAVTTNGKLIGMLSANDFVRLVAGL